jgi:catechol 2,3-dioxygenase-like lactoylglutathione lyase family enzyme
LATGFDRIQLSVPDVAAAAAELTVLLGTDGRFSAGRGLFLLRNTALELVGLPGPTATGARISGLVLRSDDGPVPGAAVDNALGLGLVLDSGDECERLRREAPAAVSPLAVDHLVVQTRDADACIALFRDRLGIRLALDQERPQWGGRMLFFRCGKMTLEIIADAKEGPEPSRFWGLALQCSDIDAESRRLRDHGVVLSAIRPGRKPGTRVATIKSHCLGLPTLLLEPPAASSAVVT